VRNEEGTFKSVCARQGKSAKQKQSAQEELEDAHTRLLARNADCDADRAIAGMCAKLKSVCKMCARSYTKIIGRLELETATQGKTPPEYVAGSVEKGRELF
jgi:hypothetical protein